MSAALDYLLTKEFSMGNGQCPECEGVAEYWAGDFRHPRPENTGHKKNCRLAQAILSVRGTVRFAEPVNDKESSAILRREIKEQENALQKLRSTLKGKSCRLI